MINQKELQQRINLSLNQKIDHALYIIDSFLGQYSDSVISFSGGIDSTVLQFFVRIIDKNRKSIFVNTTNEFSDILKFVRNSENVEIILPKITFFESVEKYGFPLISKKVARMIETIKNPTKNNEASRNLYLTGIKQNGEKGKFIIPKKYKHLINAPFNVTCKCCYYLKKKPLSKFKNGIFIGTKITDSQLRRSSYIKTGCINNFKKTCQPLSIFTDEEIWKIIKQNKIKYCEIYDKGEINTGCIGCGFGFQFDKERFIRLAKFEPKRFDQIMNLKNNGITYKEAINYTFNYDKPKRLTF